MTVSEPHRIDIVAQDPNGKIVLAMCEPRQWGSSHRMEDELKEKIQNYIFYMRSDTYKKEYGSTEASIMLIASFEPSEEIKELLEEISYYEEVEIKIKVMPARNL